MKNRKVWLWTAAGIVAAAVAFTVGWNIYSDGKQAFGKAVLKEQGISKRLLKMDSRHFNKSKRQYDINMDKKRADEANKSKPNQPKPNQPSKASQEPSNKPQQPSVQKIAYLTFDDGPSSNITPKVLDILKEENIKAVFFVVGKDAVAHPDIIKRIINEGHSIGSHTYSHNADSMYSNFDVFKYEVDNWETVMKGILGSNFSTKFFRFPGGNYGKHNHEAQYIKGKGYQFYDWTCLSNDAMPPDDKTPEQLLENIKKTMKNKTKIIVLNHDSMLRQNTLDSLKSQIEYMRSQGYSFEKLN